MNPPAPSPAETDLFWMRRALAEALQGQGFVEPNPMVGAVIVRDGQLVGVGHHQRFGGPHAEIHAIRSAGETARDATLYVTLEPCCHFGKTPPCTDAIRDAGIARVVAAQRDPFPKVAGGGFKQLRALGIDVEVGPGQAEARLLNAPFLKRLTTGRPFVIAKWAMTLDGKIACRSGDSRWISGPSSRATVHALRGRMDAIVIGIGTALADDPALTARPPGPRTPLRVVLDRQARLPVTSQLVRTATHPPLLVVTAENAPLTNLDALRNAGAEILAIPGDEPARVTALLDHLDQRGHTNILVEGGTRVLGAFHDAAEIDQVEIFLAPLLEGGAHDFTPLRGLGTSRMADATRLDNLEVSRRGSDVWLRGDVPRPWRLALDLTTSDMPR